jgi:hypothetical protein
LASRSLVRDGAPVPRVLRCCTLWRARKSKRSRATGPSPTDERLASRWGYQCPRRVAPARSKRQPSEIRRWPGPRYCCRVRGRFACVLFVVLSVCGALAAGFSAGSSAAARPAGHTALVRGDVDLCISPCAVGAFGICTPSQGCVTADRVAAVNSDRRRVATVRLHHDRFKLYLVSGRYTFELLGDGKRVHGQVLEHQEVRAAAHHTAYVHFRFDVY